MGRNAELQVRKIEVLQRRDSGLLSVRVCTRMLSASPVPVSITSKMKIKLIMKPVLYPLPPTYPYGQESTGLYSSGQAREGPRKSGEMSGAYAPLVSAPMTSPGVVLPQTATPSGTIRAYDTPSELIVSEDPNEASSTRQGSMAGYSASGADNHVAPHYSTPNQFVNVCCPMDGT
jgi:hypothetical protein